MVGRWARLAILIVAFFATASVASAEKRVALVVGNNEYQNFGSLTNPVNDAESLKNALELISFDVVFYKNTTLRQFYQALKEFHKRAKDADVALVYYAGHAVQFRGRNYLIQVDDEAETLDDINIGSIPVEKILDILTTVKGVRVLVLDACRNNPAKAAASATRSIGTELSRDVGLARLDDYDTSGGGGMVIAYATSASHVAEDGDGKNSPYNIALTKWITASDLSIPDIFTNVTGSVVAATNQRQHPSFSGSLTGKYILNPTGSEWVDWANVRNSTDIGGLQRFIDVHPDSAHAPFVRHQLDVLLQNLAEAAWDRVKDGASAAALRSFKDKFPKSPHLDDADRRISALEQAEEAERESKAWERARATNDVEILLAFRSAHPGSPHAAEADRKIAALRQQAEEAERAAKAWEGAKTANDVGALQTFRSAYPDSPHAAEADRKIASLKHAIDEQQRAEAAWERLKASTDTAALQAFRTAFPGSSHATDAAERIVDLQRKAAEAQKESTEWGRVRDSADPAILQRFLDRYPNSQFAAEAVGKLAEAQQKVEVQRSEKAWDQVKRGEDIAALERFRDTYPNSPHAAEVDQKVAAAQAKVEAERSEKSWAQLKASSDVAALVAFRDRYPGSPHAAEADRRIDELKPGQTAPKLDEAVSWDHAKTANSKSELLAFKYLFKNSTHIAEADALIAGIQSAADAETQKKAEEEARRKRAEAEVARQFDETCRREATDVADFVTARSADALTALRGRATCPKTFAAIDEGVREVKSQVCASERDQARDLGSDLEALRRASAGFACEAAIAAARNRIAELEQEKARAEQDKAREAKACEDARYDVDNKIDPLEAGARDRFAKYLTRTECPAALADARNKIADIDARVAIAQTQLKKFGCYKTEPSSLRFDRETQDAVARFQRWARRDVDATHLTADLIQTLAAFAGEGACPTSAPPPVAALPPEAPMVREAPIPRVERRVAPIPRVEKPVAPTPRFEKPAPRVPRAEKPRIERREQPRPKPPAAVETARRPASPAPPSGGGKAPYIPTPF